MERKLIVHKSEIMGGIVCFLYMLPSSMYKVNGIVMIQDHIYVLRAFFIIYYEGKNIVVYSG